MKTIILHGHLGANFGRKHCFDVQSPGEAIRALCANFKGFRQHLVQHNMPGYKVLAGKSERDADEIRLSCSADIIRIVPIVAGAGGSFGKILLGVALIAGAGFAGAALNAGGLAGTAFNVASYAVSGVKAIGFSLALGGVSQLLFAPPKVRTGENESVENRPSYVFDGAVNTVAQGNPVPVCYGELIVGSQVISTGLSVEQIPL